MSPGSRWDGKVGGFPVASSAFGLTDDEGNALSGLVAFVAFDRRVLAMVAMGPADGWAARAEVLSRSFGSFARIDDRLRDVQPMRVRVQVLDRATTIAELAEDSVLDARTLALVNQVEVGETLAQGRVVKIVAPAVLGAGAK